MDLVPLCTVFIEGNPVYGHDHVIIELAHYLIMTGNNGKVGKIHIDFRCYVVLELPVAASVGSITCIQLSIRGAELYGFQLTQSP